MLITIGVGIICFGLGMFAVKIFSKDSVTPTNKDPLAQQPQSLFQTGIANIKAKMAQKKAEKEARTKMMNEARLAALKELQPEMTKILKEEELKKMTGEDKKDKLKKFADAFSMQGTGIGSTEKINSMLGTQQPQQNNNQSQQQNNQSDFDVNEKLKRMLR